MRKPINKETKEELKRIGDRIQALRKKKFSNYEQFAFTNEINRVQYGRYENGADMKLSSLIRVLKGLDISVEDFFAEGFENDDKK